MEVENYAYYFKCSQTLWKQKYHKSPITNDQQGISSATPNHHWYDL